MEVICKSCNYIKTIDQFYYRNTERKSRSGYTTRCKACVIRSHSQQRAFDPDTKKSQDLKSRFGIGYDTYKEMLKTQNGKCNICFKPQSDFKLKFAVDHCHETGKIRGLLCLHCNHGLGKFFDKISLLERAIEYLKEDKPCPKGTNRDNG